MQQLGASNKEERKAATKQLRKLQPRVLAEDVPQIIALTTSEDNEVKKLALSVELLVTRNSLANRLGQPDGGKEVFLVDPAKFAKLGEFTFPQQGQIVEQGLHCGIETLLFA